MHGRRHAEVGPSACAPGRVVGATRRSSSQVGPLGDGDIPGPPPGTAGGRSIWITRVLLPEDLVGKRPGDAAATAVAGGRRNNPRGKRVWPLCPSAAHERALRRTLAAAAGGGELTGVDLRTRFAVATYDSEGTARRACESLEAMEVLWTAAGRACLAGGEGTAVLDRAGRCAVDYRAKFLPRAAAAALLQTLHAETPWAGVRTAAQAGQKRQPREVCYYADSADMAYTYNGRRWDPRPWTPALRRLKEQVEAACGVGFNSALLNLYEDGRDHVPWHADNEDVYGDLTDCTIASVSLGAARPFELRPAPHAAEPDAARGRRRYMLQHGSLLVMRGATQLLYEHRLPRRVRGGRTCPLRVNATFRVYKRPPQAAEAGESHTTNDTDDCAALSGDSSSSSESDEGGDGEEGAGCGDPRHRFAARPITPRLFVGHGHKALPPCAADALAALFRPFLAAGRAAASPPSAEVEASHRGYAFATLPAEAGLRQEHIVDILAALDGEVVDLPGTGAPTELNMCPATEPVCKHFLATGACRLGEACRFRHS
eukprot:TRINITY_DN7645_c0_g1_i1.p1 TRINITY_DN7645_c0_g1~~TRINITY_DN7645_c0_g1_i1.p1  ORF type:complete len:543 (+),score=90.35 TRINITY_DN7645_c0_g1_i1:211-1839(+)